MKRTSDLISQVYEKTDFSKVAIHEIITAFVDELCEEVSAGNDVQITGLGTFTTVRRTARVRHNAHTGELYLDPEGLSPKFNFSTNVKRAIRRLTEEEKTPDA